jgi:hypothetical protein
MRSNILYMIGIELSVAGWMDEAIEKEQCSMRHIDEEQLSAVYWDLRLKRMEHNKISPDDLQRQKYSY